MVLESGKKTDREGTSYHYHSKMRVVTAIPKKSQCPNKSGGHRYFHHSRVQSNHRTITPIVRATACTISYLKFIVLGKIVMLGLVVLAAHSTTALDLESTYH
jgi:hypothetical protein